MQHSVPTGRKTHYLEQFPEQVKFISIQTNMQALLLAAGYGTRLQPFTNIRPKPLFPVVNRPLLHILLQQLQACGCRSVVVNCHHLAGQVETALHEWPGVLVQYEPEILGTGGSLRLALERLEDDPVLVVNGDLYHQIDLEQVYRRHLLSKNEVTLALHDYCRFNTVTVAADRVTGFGSTAAGSLAFTGIHVINPKTIERIPRQGFYHIIDLYRQLAAEGKIGYCRVDGSLWRDIGTPADYLQLHQHLLHSEDRWVIDPGASIGADVQMMGWGCIGPDAVIGDGTRLCRCVVWEGARLASGSVFTDAIITGDPAIDQQWVKLGSGVPE